jgi:hypothetical protein
MAMEHVNVIESLVSHSDAHSSGLKPGEIDMNLTTWSLMLNLLIPCAYTINLTTHIHLTADQISYLTCPDPPAPNQHVVMMYTTIGIGAEAVC